jgi:hypothetical protein
LRLLKDKSLAEDVVFSDEEEIFCEACLEGKQHQLPFLKIGYPKSKELLELVYLDIFGPMKNTG